jgi:nitrogen regulatory protein PII
MGNEIYDILSIQAGTILMIFGVFVPIYLGVLTDFEQYLDDVISKIRKATNRKIKEGRILYTPLMEAIRIGKEGRSLIKSHFKSFRERFKHMVIYCFIAMLFVLLSILFPIFRANLMLGLTILVIIDLFTLLSLLNLVDYLLQTRNLKIAELLSLLRVIKILLETPSEVEEAKVVVEKLKKVCEAFDTISKKAKEVYGGVGEVYSEDYL